MAEAEAPSRVLSVAAAAFRPNQDGYEYDNAGYLVQHISFGNLYPDSSAYYFAPVHLPHDSIVTGLTAYLADNHPTKSGSVELIETALATGSVSTYVASVASPAGISSDFTPYSVVSANKLVDNQHYAYYLRYATPMEQTTAETIILGGVQISYREQEPTSPSFYSLTAADFTPFSQENDYSNSGARLESGGITNVDYQAGINLPNGARIDSLTFTYYGSTTKTVSATMAKTGLDGVYHPLGGVSSALAAGSGSSSTTTFSDNEIRNGSFTFWMFYRFSSGPIAYGVSIQYTPRIYDTDETLWSVSAASFVPRHGNYTYQNQGRLIVHQGGGDDETGNYMAPFSPPTGVSISLIYFMVGNSINSTPGELVLLRVTDEFDLDDMWRHESESHGGWYGIGSGLIRYNPIDYLHTTYYLRINLPTATVSDWVNAVGAKGEWAYQRFLPAVRR